MFKLETMIYASEDGTSSVFTLNPALQKQLEEARQQSIDKAVWKKLEQAADAYLQQLAQPSDAAEPIKEGEQA